MKGTRLLSDGTGTEGNRAVATSPEEGQREGRAASLLQNHDEIQGTAR